MSVVLVAFVDEQLPEEPRADDLRRPRHAVPAQHDEADRLVAGVDRPVPRVRLRVLVGLLERFGNRAHEPLLSGSEPECEHLVVIGIRQLTKGHQFVHLTNHAL